jgi:transcriptional regulator with XRE-family HTH domain
VTTKRTYMSALLDQRERQAIEARQGRPYPERITLALDARALYGPEVDVACGAVEPAVDRWETGEEEPTWEQLEKLAALTGYPVSFFFIEPGERLTGGFFCIRGGKGKGCYPLTGDLPPNVEQLDLIAEEAVERVEPPVRPDPPPPGDLPECSGPCGRPMRRATWVKQQGRCSRCGPA